MTTSNTAPAEQGHLFDVEKFARQTVWAVEYGDACAEVLERRVVRIEEAVCAPWYRRWLLWRRLRHEIRASVVTWDPEYIPRDDFHARRIEAVSQQADEIAARQKRARAEGWPEPGEVLLP